MARALVSSGLLPTFGIHHRNKYNAYCLADDVMEPYRPYVDRLVIDMVNEKFHLSLTTEMKMRLLGIPTIDVYIDGKRSPLIVAVTTTTASLQRCYYGESRRIIYPSIEF